jgi:uncharacterized membrane protein YccF (DUF307 family)
MSQYVLTSPSPRPGCLLQVLWFVFIGSWFTFIWVSIAWFFLLTIVGIPLGVWMLHRVPLVLALRDPTEVRAHVRQIGKDTWVYEESGVPQRPFLIRAIYFLLVGWWLSGLWMTLAYLVCLTIIGLPLGIWMFDLVPALVSLRR